MPKLVKNLYYNAKGEAKICTFTIPVAKVLVQEAGLDPEKNCELKAEKGKIIITQK